MTNTADIDAKLIDTMHARVLSAVADRVIIGLDLGHDLYDPATDTTPVGEYVITWANNEARRLGFSAEAAMMLRADVRAVVRTIVREAWEAATTY